MKFPLSYLATCLLLLPSLHAEEDSPTPLLLKEAATGLRDDANQLAKHFKTASTGKQWGLSPGHKALYQAIFAYRNELQITIEMSKPAESPDRLLKVILDSRALGKRVAFLSKFIIIPDEIRKEITKVSQGSNILIPHVQKYETRYFVWKKVELVREHAEEECNRPDIIIVHPNEPQTCPIPKKKRPIVTPCPPSKPIRLQPSKPIRKRPTATNPITH